MNSEEDCILLVVGDEHQIKNVNEIVKCEPIDDTIIKSEVTEDEFDTVVDEIIVKDVKTVTEDEFDSFVDEYIVKDVKTEYKYEIKIETDDDYSSDWKPKKKYNFKKRKINKNDSVNDNSSVALDRPMTLVEMISMRYDQIEDEMSIVKALEQEMRAVELPKLPKKFYNIDHENNYKCLHCETVTKRLPVATRHYYEKHGPRYLKCFACGVDFRSRTNLYKHEKRCVNPDAPLMLKARARFLGRKGRQRPYLSHQDPPSKSSRRFHCNTCSASFVTKVSLESHENLHRGVRPYCCHVCANSYTSQNSLQRHLLQHSDAQFICDYCEMSFKAKGALVSHMDTHKERKYACSECDKRYAQKAALNIHILRVHKNLPYPFGCPMCPKRYPRMSLVKSHMMKVHGSTILTQKMLVRALPGQPSLNTS